MSKNSFKKYILFITIIFLVKGKINNIDKIINEYCDSNNIASLNSPGLPENEEDFYNLRLGSNSIQFNEGSSYYKLDLNIISEEEKNKMELLIYTNLTDRLFYLNENTNQSQAVSMFYIIPNEYIIYYDYLKFEIKQKNESDIGFINFLLVNEGEFTVNQNIIRENFYNRNITLLMNENKKKYFINTIPSDNNSDIYYIQIHYYIEEDVDRDEEKDKIKLYYLNNINNDTIEGLIEDIKKKPLKRDKKINGKIEIILVEYNNLKKNIKLNLEYNRIKGEGILGFILSLSVLSFILIILVIIFLKNVYCGNIKTPPPNNIDENMNTDSTTE